MKQTKSPSIVGLLLSELALLTFGATLLHSEDVIVTGCIDNHFNGCAPSCPANLGTTELYPRFSTADPAGADRSMTMFGITNTATWAVTPTLGSSTGVYRVYVSQGTTNTCPTDLVVKLVATSDCTLATTNYEGRTEILNHVLTLCTRTRILDPGQSL